MLCKFAPIEVFKQVLHCPRLQSSDYWRNSLERPPSVLRQLRHFHTIHLASAPVGNSSLGLSAIHVAGIRLEYLSSHIAIRILLEENVVRGLMLFRKLSLDANRFASSTWLKRGCRLPSTCLLRSFMLATRRLKSGGAMPAKTCSLSVFTHCVCF